MSRYVGAREDEVFVGNIATEDGVPEQLSSLRTARIGEQALDIEGKEIDPACMRPLFIHRSEMDQYESIMMERFRNACRRGGSKPGG